MFSNMHHINLHEMAFQPSSCSTRVAKMQKMSQSQNCPTKEFWLTPRLGSSQRLRVPLSRSFCRLRDWAGHQPNLDPLRQWFLNLECKESSEMFTVKCKQSTMSSILGHGPPDPYYCRAFYMLCIGSPFRIQTLRQLWNMGGKTPGNRETGDLSSSTMTG